MRNYVYGRMWEETNDKRLELLDNNRKGVSPTSSVMPLGEYLTHWLDDIAVHNLRPSTFTRYRYSLPSARPRLHHSAARHEAPESARHERRAEVARDPRP